MWKVFANASCVRVWLGGTDEALNNAIDYLSFVSPAESKLSLDDAISLQHFFQLPWFYRRWVVQEVALNANVVFYCGLTRKISWTTLHLQASRLPTDFWAIHSLATVRNLIEQLGYLWLRSCYTKRFSNPVGLWDLLHDLTHLECANNKDRIYAFTGLADDVYLGTKPVDRQLFASKLLTTEFVLKADYGRSDADLFASITRPRLQSSSLLYCTLAFAGAYRPLGRARRFPSWIPDFSLPRLWAADPVNDRTYLGENRISEHEDGSMTLAIHAQSWRSVEVGSEHCANTISDVCHFTMDAASRTAVSNIHSSRAWLYSVSPELGENAEKIIPSAITGIMSQIDFKTVSDQSTYVAEEEAAAAAQKWLFGADHPDLVDDPTNDNNSLDVLRPLFEALAGRRFFVGRVVKYRARLTKVDRLSKFVGFGPSDLRGGDEFISSSTSGKALFFRPTERGHELLGGGFCRLPVKDAELPPRREVTYHII